MTVVSLDRKFSWGGAWAPYQYLALVAGKYLDGYYCGPESILLGTLSVGLGTPYLTLYCS